MEKILGRCGVYCGQCDAFHGVVAELATKLKEKVEEDFSWAQESTEFNYQETLKGLSWFMKQTCPGCRQIEETWCDVYKCKKIRENQMDNCLLCAEFPSCNFTSYQRKRYSYLLRDFEQIKEIGMEEYLKLQQKRAEDGIRLQDIRDY